MWRTPLILAFDNLRQEESETWIDSFSSSVESVKRWPPELRETTGASQNQREERAWKDLRDIKDRHVGGGLRFIMCVCECECVCSRVSVCARVSVFEV